MTKEVIYEFPLAPNIPTKDLKVNCFRIAKGGIPNNQDISNSYGGLSWPNSCSFKERQPFNGLKIQEFLSEQ